MLGYLCAYLRYYYPYEFVASYFNNVKTQADIANCKKLTTELNIQIKEPRFRHARYEYFIDKSTRSVYKGLKGIKFMNEIMAEELYKLKDNEYNNFMEVLSDLTTTSIRSNQRDILIELDFFEEFGNSNTLKEIVKAWDFLKQGAAKEIKKDADCDATWLDIISRFSKETATRYKILNMSSVLSEIGNYITAQQLPSFPYKQKFEWQLEYLGYIAECSNSNDMEERKKLIILECKALKTKRGANAGLPWAYVVHTKSVGSGKESEFTIYAEVYNKNPIHKFDIIKLESFFQKGQYWFIGKYHIIR